ncbi:MAG: type II toxin-antitoxin system RelE/ParE family toxin [Syntrophobacter sp.]
MPKYSILIKSSAVKEIESIGSKRDRQSIVSLIEALAENPRPHGSEKLSGQERYRLRKGRYRVVYSIIDQELVVFAVKVGQRKDVYR